MAKTTAARIHTFLAQSNPHQKVEIAKYSSACDDVCATNSWKTELGFRGAEFRILVVSFPLQLADEKPLLLKQGSAA